LAVLALLALLALAPTQPPSRLEAIRARGVLTCGVEPAVPGFAEVDAQGRYRGFDVDICRAVAAAIFGSADKVKYVPVLTVEQFRKSPEVDVVSRRLTWELQREAALGLLFGPITFYDGQGFLVSKKLGVSTPKELARTEICVAGGTVFEFNLGSYFAGHEVKKVVLESATEFGEIAKALTSGRCRTYSADVSELGAIRSRLAEPANFTILPDQISREPLAPLVRGDDARFFTLVRWTVLALINAEELGVTSQNVDDMRKSKNVGVQRLLGTVPGNGKALGLTEEWAYHAIKAVGNYGELFEKNIGRDSPLGLDRGLNRLSTDGGLMYSPPLR
jgi:general L-amino acid transport system substrate-binding protein